jgi:hypothetical protein
LALPLLAFSAGGVALFIVDERIFLPITMMVGMVGNVSREKTRKELMELQKKASHP